MYTLEVNAKRLIGIHKAFILLNFHVQHLINMRHYYTFLIRFICAMKKVNLKRLIVPCSNETAILFIVVAQFVFQ